ncbi:hypothetical protein BJF93_12660 [Xaviernesmea oryzae]|uniref:GGDEF domain-containing protein n=1 Tax=Xaviernesmea oryzae TaxID=464029 RepID=A0A1Q9AQX8_9HYPH|nr:hypothetical protein BJF93_12660 [Xaviernesmea oryzae]
MVAELAYSIIPTSILGAITLIIGVFSAASLARPLILEATIVTTVMSFLKVAVMILHRQRNKTGHVLSSESLRWEMMHGALTLAMAAGISTLATMIFLAPDLSLQMLATVLIFGYAAGVITRVSVRPAIAASAVITVGFPPIAACVLAGDRPHLILAATFLAFILAGMQSVVHVYRTAKRQIGLKHDMAALAQRDSLTRLPNRLAIREASDNRAWPSDRAIALHCFDVDGFKLVNDAYGHQIGDRLLEAIADRLRAILPEGVMAARVGGDEFMVLQPGLSDEREAERLAYRLFANLTEPYDLDGRLVRIGVSIGYAIAPGATADRETMIRQADAASYIAKRRGGGVEYHGAATQDAAHQNSTKPAASPTREAASCDSSPAHAAADTQPCAAYH